MTYYLVSRLLVSMLGSGISIYLLSLLGTSGNTKERIAGRLLAFASLTMYLTDLISAVILAAGSTPESLAYLVPCNVSSAAGALMPTVIFYSWQQSTTLAPASQRRNLLRWSLFGGGLFSIALWLPLRGTLRTDTLHIIIGIYDLLVVLLGFAVFRFSSLTKQMRLCLTITRNAAVVGLLALLAAIANQRLLLIFVSLSLVAQLSLLVAILGSFIFFTRFRYADVFATRSVRLIGLSLFAVLALLVIHFIAGTFGWGVLGTLLVVITIVGFTASVSAILPRLDLWVTRRILFQPDWKGVLDSFSFSMHTMQAHDQLIKWVDEHLAACLLVASTRTIPIASLDQKQLDRLRPFADILEKGADTRQTPSQPDVLVPIMIDDSLRFAILIDLGPARGNLLSSEFQFLRALARQIGTQIRRIETAEAKHEQQIREALLERQVSQAELRALRAQINPHFLFNSLNTIADLVITDPLNAERITLRLASIFRHVLRQSDRQLIRLQEEFEFLQNYALIEQERFGKRLKVNFELDPDAADILIPTLLLQPLFENSVKHGIAPKQQGGSILVRAVRIEDVVEIQIEDDGNGFDITRGDHTVATQDRSNGVGLSNTAARLKTTYSDLASIHIARLSPSGCRVSIVIPCSGVFSCAL
jgi:anti-sigma regulatory factor (Ser/Thr protein kinase)/GAF domain-containing protein